MKNQIRNIQQIMRKDEGIDGDAQRISQLSWLLFLKIFDQQEKELEIVDANYKNIIKSEFQWRSWAEDPEGITGERLIQFVENELFVYLRSLNIHNDQDVSKIIRFTFTDNYNFIKSGTILRQVINEINTIDFDSQSERHQFGDIYEGFLEDLQSAGNAGEYYTPRAVTKFIVETISPQLNEKIIDPATGTGGFLRCATDYLRENNNFSLKDEIGLKNNLFGIEKKPIPYVLCMTNMLLHMVRDPINIIRDNSLNWDQRDVSESKKFDAVITNPPFGGMEEDGTELNFPERYRTKETASLFLYFIMNYLKDGGRCGLVLPDGFMSGMKKKKTLKEKLFLENNVHTIIRLPKFVFYPYTDISTNIIFFEKGKPTKETWFYFQPYPEGYKYTKKQHIKFEEFKETSIWMKNQTENKFATKLSIEEIIKREFDIDIKNPNEEAEVLPTFEEVIKDATEISNKINKLLKALND